MALFGFGDDDSKQITEPVDPNWVRTPEGGFLPLLTLDPEELGLNNVGGVYLVWHAGVRPEWVYAGHSNNLAAALHQAGNDPDINYFEKNGGLFVAWAPVMEKYRAGVVKYLNETYNVQVPNVSDFSDETVPVPVIPPVAKRG
jgi:hypothetical protein